jgi:hypothetical protein
LIKSTKQAALDIINAERRKGRCTMRSKFRAGRGCRLVAMLVLSVPLLVATAAPATAAAPANDDITNATAIASLPFHDTVEISQATFDPATDVSFCYGSGHSVWYSFTAASSDPVAFDPSPSSGAMNIDVFTGTSGELSFVGCGQGGPPEYNRAGFILNATAGTTYWIMASTLCCFTAPDLDLWVYPAVPPQATLSVSDGKVDRGGNVTVTGTLDCAGTVPNGVALSGDVQQAAGRLSSVSAEFAATVSCAPTLEWSALAQPNAGKFAGGYATVNAAVWACNIVGCAWPRPSTTVVIRLHG